MFTAHHSPAFALTLAGLSSAGATVIAAAFSIADAAPTSDLGPYITGGGALTTSAVLGIIAVKLARGELVAREPARVEAQLAQLVADHAELVAGYRSDHEALRALRLEDRAERAADRARVDTLVDRAITAFQAKDR